MTAEKPGFRVLQRYGSGRSQNKTLIYLPVEKGIPLQHQRNTGMWLIEPEVESPSNDGKSCPE